MKSIKLLLITFTVTFLLLMTVSPAFAKPSIKIQHLQISTAFSDKHNHYNLTQTIKNVPSTIASGYSNNFSTGLILSNPTLVLNEKLLNESSTMTINVVNQSNKFFSSAMTVSDTLNQFISYFSPPNKSGTTEQRESVSENKEMKIKCNKSTNLS